MRRFRIRTLKVRLIVSIFVIITSVYALVAMLVFLAHYGGLFKPENLYYIEAWSTLLLIATFFFASVIIGLLVFYRFSGLFLDPMKELALALKEVEKGNYNVEVRTDVPNRELRSVLTRFNRMAKEISSVEMLKKDFITYFSHEFKTPITSIHGFSKEIKEHQLDPEKQAEYADIIFTESERLINMSSNVLMLTKLEHQRALTDKNEFQVDEQVRRSLLVLEKNWTAKRLELDLNLDDVSIESSEELIAQIWLNVIGNAIHYSNDGDKLTITATSDDNFIKVRVCDTGIGMSDKVRERVFEKFYRGDAVGAKSGNGLGMSIVKRIVDLCGGRIIVKSQKGKGTTVVVYLPKQRSEGNEKAI